MPTTAAAIAVIGGSGLYSLFDPSDSSVVSVKTPYGPVDVTLGPFAGRQVAFITRHGTDHSVPPHLINYRANIWALASLGVRVILSSSAVGGLSSAYPPGTLALTDQFIDRTWGRADTFYDEGVVHHLTSADPFDPALHDIARAALSAAGEPVIDKATVIVIQGPRFSTRAESQWFAAAGGDIINMTMYPEVTLASELNIATVNLAYITDSDAGIEDDHDDADSVSHTLVLERLMAAQPRIVAAIETIVRAIPDDFASGSVPAETVAQVLERPAER